MDSRPKSAAFDGIPHFELVRRRGTNDCRCLYECDEINPKGEHLLVELTYAGWLGSDIARVWHKMGYTDNVLEDWWSLNTYAYDESGKCRGGYNPMEIFNNDPDIRKVLMQLINGTYAPQDPELFRPLYNSLLNTQSTAKADTYFILKDFKSYSDARARIVDYYGDQAAWARSAILNVACSGKFTSDRTIKQYVDITAYEGFNITCCTIHTILLS